MAFRFVFGGIAVQKTLSKEFSGKYTVGSGYSTNVTRLKYTVPEDAGVNSENLKHCIDLCIKNGQWKLSLQNHKIWNIL